MAPEVLAQQGHGFCVDYWGLGMLVYEMMTGLPPWYTTDRAKLFRRLRSAPLDIPSYFSQSSASCVSALLERNPRRRLGVTGVRAAMEHEFFRSISWRALYGRRVEAPIRPCEGWSPPEGVSEDGDPSQPPHDPSTSTTPNTNKTMEYDNLNLDAATANFDNTFTRMPVESDHENANDGEDEGDLDELHEDTFIGFTFDDNDRDEMAAVQAAAARQRTHPYTNVNNGTNPNPNPAVSSRHHID
jgi:serine/threonine protein kinase